MWDVATSALVLDDWCSSFTEPITSVTGGEFGGFCTDWDDTWVSASFTPPTAIATSECNDPNLPWAYSID